MYTKKYQVKVAAMPQRSVNWTVLAAVAVLMALLAMFATHVSAYAQEVDSQPVQITDEVVLKGLLEGDLSVLENGEEVRAAAEPVMGSSVRHHWGYPGNLQVYVNNTSSTVFSDFVIQARLKNGQIDMRQLSANMTPKSTYFVRNGQETDPVAVHVSMSHGGQTNSMHDATTCLNGPMVVINRWNDGSTYPTIQNIFVGREIYYRLVGATDWRQLANNAYEGWRLNQNQGSVEIKLQPTDQAPLCLLVSWDWTLPVTLTIPDTTTVVGNEIMVPLEFRNNTGQIYSIDARLQYSPTHLSFVGIDQAGTATQNFQYILNTGTPGSIIITGQGQQPITTNSGLMLRLKFRALRAGTVPVMLSGVQVPEVLINGGSMPVAGEYGQVTVNASLWTGAVYFWNGNKPMKDVTVTLSNGIDVVTATTGWDGGYTAALPTMGTWTATFSKQKSEYDRHAVSSMDAALTHQRAALRTTFGIPYMEWSADADDKQPITSYDANRILRFAARYNDSDAACGDWRGEAITVEVNGPTSSGHITKLWLMCDVTGNWLPGDSVAAAEVAETPNITTTVISTQPLVVRISSEQPFSGLALQFDQSVQSVMAAGFDTVQPNAGFVPLASMTDPVSSVDLTIIPTEGTQVLTLESITVDELSAVNGPTMSLDPQDEMPILQLELYLPLVSAYVEGALGEGPDPLQ
ncbi:hypothetical protein IPM65_02150 [Candidatus Roizmanbacteria bacterium]|nr:MAG: hypothetical protein IPM65_02150 [Candidatus Roizmanbacteria bacterium]